MADFKNRIFDEIAIGEAASVSHAVTAPDIELLATAGGEVEPYYLNETAARALNTQGASAIGFIAGLLNRRLPGPGTTIVGSSIRYGGAIAPGDVLTSSVTVVAKDPARHEIEFACRCDNQSGDVLLEGTMTVSAPLERLTYSDIARPDVILRRNDGFVDLLARCRGLPPVVCAVVHPCDRDSLLGAIEAARRNLLVPVLVGPEAKIRAVAAAEGVDLSPYRIVATEHSHAAAATAVALARAGEVAALMKGSLHTDELMSAVVMTSTGLRTARRMSHVYAMEVPTYPRMLLVTDAAINICPSLADKADIVQNAIELAHVLGIAAPKVAVLSAVETVNPKIVSTLHAAALCKMAERGQITGGIIDGPLGFDNAISEHAATAKGIVSPVAGKADILLVPDLEAGNMIAKQLQYLAGADAAGIVLGARVPIVLTSRADSVRTRLASTALLQLVANAKQQALPAPAV